VLYLQEFLNFSVLFVIGGNVRDRERIGEDMPVNTIKVFKLEKRMVSNSPILTLTTLYGRCQPIVFYY
jgi:hypothetical protein